MDRVPRLPHLSNNVQGIALIAAGLVLILHVTGIIERSLDMVILLGAIVMIGYGFLKLDGYNRLMNLFQKKQH